MSQAARFAVFSLLLLASGRIAFSLPTGAPSSACTTLTQIHGSNSVTDCSDDCPFSVSLVEINGTAVAAGTQTYKCGSLHTLRIQSSDSTTFRGFAIQARQSTEAFSNDASFLGQFDSDSAVAASDWKIWECATDSATHTSRSDKTSVDVQWKAPANFGPNVTMWFSITRVYSTFHAQLKGLELSPDASCQPSGTVGFSCDFAVDGSDVVASNCQAVGFIPSSIECQVNDQPAVTCTTPYRFLSSNFSGAGTHTLRVIAGTFFPETIPVTVRTSSSQITINPRLSCSSDSDQDTGIITVSCTANGVPDAVFCLIDGEPFAPCELDNIQIDTADYEAGSHILEISFSSGGLNSSATQLTFRVPNSVSVTSDPPNPIQPIGSTVTLTCTVVLAKYVEGLTVNTEWTGPNGFSENGMAQRMGSTTTYTSTAMVSSFGRKQSGDYTCTATVISDSESSLYVVNKTMSSSTRVIFVGVYLSLKGVAYPNNSVILITEIEQTNTTLNNGLQCITDRRPCCSSENRQGEWFYPGNGEVIPESGDGKLFYRNRGDDGTVNLNRLNNDVMMPTGRFCCVLPDANGVSQWACAVILQSKPIVSPTSNLPNPILSGSDVTLTCTVELSPAVDVPVTVNTVWTGPSTTSISVTHLARVQDSLTLYRSSRILESVESSHYGQYKCTAKFGIEVSASINIEIVDGMFQLRLKGVDICTRWYITRSSKEAIKYVNYVNMALVEAVERHCKCHFPFTNLLEGSFSCEESPDLMTYRSALFGTHNFNGSRIISFIQDWVSSGPRIKIDRRSHVRVDSSCPVALTSLDEPESVTKAKP